VRSTKSRDNNGLILLIKIKLANASLLPFFCAFRPSCWARPLNARQLSQIDKPWITSNRFQNTSWRHWLHAFFAGKKVEIGKKVP